MKIGSIMLFIILLFNLIGLIKFQLLSSQAFSWLSSYSISQEVKGRKYLRTFDNWLGTISVDATTIGSVRLGWVRNINTKLFLFSITLPLSCSCVPGYGWQWQVRKKTTLVPSEVWLLALPSNIRLGRQTLWCTGPGPVKNNFCTANSGKAEHLRNPPQSLILIVGRLALHTFSLLQQYFRKKVL